ncbi:hypothetical protein [Aurantimonas sp. VKM B-3413]|uniref:hypothetical protein n=1 Tax=Aurantimonas sp. VKM B-3413 TaxID=2779401 RepID=UPI001E360FF5|nr:hypothetical protein [Aurantimonas sp. VKM B-3413]MCB8837820.1 hypothetical protein [Aurantimonas sp. VKM B-3413]
MGSWVGPAIIAAIIVGIFTGAGWFVTASLALRAEDRKRSRRVRELQIALRAEIVSELSDLESDPDLNEEDKEAVISRNMQNANLFVPAATPNRIFEALVSEFPLLDAGAIEPVVLYAHQRDIANGCVPTSGDRNFWSYPSKRRRRSCATIST